MINSDLHIFEYAGKLWAIDVPACTVTAWQGKKDALGGKHSQFGHTSRDCRFTPLQDVQPCGFTPISIPAEADGSKPSPVSHLALFVTQSCNLNCIYCYGDGGRYGSSGNSDLETMKRGILWLVENSGDIDELHISFFGGEPLLNFFGIKEAVEYARIVSKTTEKTFKFHITTNLLLLNDDILEFLVNNRIEVTVSFDGEKETQDSQRPYKNNQESTYEDTLPKIRMLLSRIPNAVCRATLCGDTDPKNVRHKLEQIGFSYIFISSVSPSLHPVVHVTRRSSGKILSLMQEDAEEFLVSVRDRNQGRLNQLKHRSGFIFSMISMLLSRKQRFFPCGAGRKYVAMSNSGDIFLCHRFVGSEEEKLGCVWDGVVDRSEFQKSPTYKISECRDCFARFQCAGRCYHDNKASTGSILSPSEFNCILMRRAVEIAAYVTANLALDDRLFLVKESIMPTSTLDVPSALAQIRIRRTEIISELKRMRSNSQKQ